MSKISAIAGNDVHKITSSQVIVDLITCVKELVDNSIDAGARNVEVIFKNYGMDCIECSDDGDGISPENLESLALKHFTSKIRSFQDVSNVMTLGFRGEALSSICAVAHMSVVTTTKPPRADKLEYDTNGVMTSKSTVSRNKGTTVQISDLFYNLPVRKKELEKNHKRQFSKCLSLLQNYALIQNDIQLSVWNVTSNQRKRLILSTAKCQDMSKRILSIFGSSSMRGLSPIDLELDLNPYKKLMNRHKIDSPAYFDLDYRIKVNGYISKNSFGCGRSAKDRQSVSVNKRPVEYPALLQCCNEVYHTFNNVQFPTVFLDLSLPPQLLDVNVTPDKRTIMLHNERFIIEVFKENLINYYDNQELVLPKSGLSQAQHPTVKKRRLASQVLDSAFREDDSSDHEGLQVSLTTDSENKRPENSCCSAVNEEVTTCERDSVSLPNVCSSPIASKADLLGKPVGTKEPHRSDSCFDDGSKDVFSQVSVQEASEDDVKTPKSQSLSDTLQRYKKSPPEYGTFNEKDVESPEQSESVVVEIDGKKMDYQAKYSKNDGLAFICDAASSPTKSCCKDHAHSEQNGIDSEEDYENDSFYASMEPREVNIRFDTSRRATQELNRPVYRSLTNNSDFKRSESNGLVITRDVSNSLGMVHEIANLVTKQRQKHVNSFKTNENIEDFDEGERYLTLTVKKSDFQEMNIVGQFNLGFIIVTRQAQGKYDLFIIDQHASDEKYNFEMLQKTTTFKSQRLIAPLPVELSVIDELLVMEHLDLFEKNGFKLIINEQEDQGAKIEIVSLPVSKRTLFDVDDFHELIYLIKENSGLHRNNIRCSKIRSMFAMRACRSSIMIGKPLAKTTMTKVVRHLSELDKPWNCPHGRPTMRHLMELKDWNSFSNDYEI